MVHDRGDHGAVLEDAVDAVARRRARVEPKAQLLRVLHHGDAKILVDPLQDPDLVHRQHGKRAGGGHDDHRGDDDEAKQDLHAGRFAQRRHVHIARVRKQHHRRLHVAQRLGAADRVHEDVEAEKTDRGAEAKQRQVQCEQREEVPDLGEDIGPGGNVDAAKTLEVEA